MLLVALLALACHDESPPRPAAASVEEAPVMKTYAIRDAQINARNSGFSDPDVDRLLADPELVTVKGMDLTGARLSADALGRLLADSRLAGLQRLFIGSSAIGDAGLLVIGQAPCAPALQELHVPDVGASPEGIAAFAAAAGFDGVSILIGHQTVGDAGAIGLAGGTGIAKLDLESGEVGTAGAVALLSTSTAQRLSLRDNPIHLDGLQALSPTLSSVSFKMTPLTEADLVILGAAPAPGLEELNFEQVAFTDAGLEAVRRASWLAQLEAVSIGAKKTSPEARRAFLSTWGDDRWISIYRKDLK